MKFTADTFMDLERIEIIRLFKRQERLFGEIKISASEIVEKSDKRLNLTKRRVYKYLQDMESEGTIKVIQKGNRSNPTEYEVLI